ncbi:MAG: hypothetical protein V7K18_27245 [Nostoc sp.]|uniref:hypothetical protein n=1 Tax=Nostoc sp. TaxID=1180 RepID=UPI002FF4D4E2
MHPQLKFITKGDRLYKGYSESAMSMTGYVNAPIAEFSRRCDRLYKGHFSDVYDGLCQRTHS